MNNPNQTLHKDFTIEILPDAIIISKTGDPGNRLVFPPGHGERLKYLVGSAMRMEDFAALPEFISGDPFVIFFSENGNLKIRNEDSTLVTQFEFCDDLIEAVDVAIAKVRDERTLRPGRRGTGAYSSSPDPVIDGR